jgi:hypothetical protein
MTDIGAVVSWVKSTVGLPRWLSHKVVGDNVIQVTVPMQNKRVKEYFEVALAQLLPQVKSMANLKRLRKGAHFIPITRGGFTFNSWVIVNGTKAYIGMDKEKTGDIIWDELVDPVIGNYYFIPDEAEVWSTEISGISDLREKTSTTLAEVYTLMSRSIEVAWVFEEEDTAHQYLASAMILNCLNGMLDRHIYTILNGEPSTGKSTFSDFFMEGPDRLLECCIIDDEYSAASFRTKANGWPGGIWLDEFEDKQGTAKGRMVRQCLEHLRGLTSRKIAKISRGTSSNTKTIDFELQCQVWASSVEPLRRLADITRFVRFRTVKKKDHGDSIQILQEHFSEEHFKGARRFLSIHLYNYYASILTNIEALRAIYTRKAASEHKTKLAESLSGGMPPPRFMGMLVMCAAVVKSAGNDPHSFIRKVCSDQEDWISIMSETSTHSQLFNDILSAAVTQKLDSDSGRTTIRNILSSSSERTRLSEYNVGLAYVEFLTHKWLIVHWEDALPNLLSRSKPLTYNNEVSSRLQAKANRDTRTVGYHKARKLHQGQGGFKKYLGAGIRIQTCSIYDISKIIKEFDDEA